jgi:ornithine cyclodeaminase/alanine dehydrogenase-like protein (mu-crystallin family)
LTDWVYAVERAYVAIATNGAPAIALQLGTESPARIAAASGAVASRFLAVGTPRSLSLIIDPNDDGAQLEAALLGLEAHRTWFSPADVRCTGAALAARANGRAVSVGEALAADIVCSLGATPIAARQLRRGTHVNALGDPRALDPELLALATVVDAASLPAMAAGFVDGRQLDELTVFRYCKL